MKLSNEQLKIIESALMQRMMWYDNIASLVPNATYFLVLAKEAKDVLDFIIKVKVSGQEVTL